MLMLGKEMPLVSLISTQLIRLFGCGKSNIHFLGNRNNKDVFYGFIILITQKGSSLS